MGIVKSFEQKFFFNWSRHLWNFLGISGFIALSTGVILFLNSTFIESYKSKKDYFGNDYVLVIRIFFNKVVIIINKIFESNYKEYKAKSHSLTDYKVLLNDKK